MTPKQIAEAWHSVTDRWFTRCDKMHKTRQWEVVHADRFLPDSSQRIVGRFGTQGPAERRARQLEDEARGAAVLRAIENDAGDDDEFMGHPI